MNASQNLAHKQKNNQTMDFNTWGEGEEGGKDLLDNA